MKTRCRLCNRDSNSKYCTYCRKWGVLMDRQELLKLLEANPRLTAKEAAAKLETSLDRVYWLAKPLGLKFYNPLTNEGLREYIASEITNPTYGALSKIAKDLGISRERVRQIVNKLGLTPVCPVCGDSLPTRRMRYHQKCRKALRSGRLLRLCIICGNRLGKGEKILCSEACREVYRKKKRMERVR